jgi:hypothetical protein
LPERFGFEPLGFSDPRDFLAGNPYNVETGKLILGGYLPMTLHESPVSIYLSEATVIVFDESQVHPFIVQILGGRVAKHSASRSIDAPLGKCSQSIIGP